MKNLINTTARALLLSTVACLLLLSSCSDKVDSYLNKADNVLDRYEKLASDKKFGAEDKTKMMREINELDQDFKLNVGIEPDTWKADQRARRVKFAARIEKLDDAARLYERSQ